MADAVEDIMRLMSCQGVGPRTFARLRHAFGSVEDVLRANKSELMGVKEVGPKVAGEILRCRDYDPRPELARAAEIGAKVLGIDDAEYPPALRNSFDPPALLYVKGDILPRDSIAIAIVGTRRLSAYGRSQAERFASLLARMGVCVVSGLARGVDSVAHRSCMTARGRTLAVMGSGLGHIYPEENRDLASEISQSGAVISEFPIDTGPSRENFPRRNRIIAALTLGTLVVEAPMRSGALITARFANEYGREVYAIPGRIDQRNAEGCNNLIARGQAKLVQNMEDIMEELGPLAENLKKEAGVVVERRVPQEVSAQAQGGASGNSAQMAQPAQSPAEIKEQKILEAVGTDTIHIDDICVRSGLPVHEVSAGLMMLELKRQVKQRPGKFFVKA